MSVKPNLKAIYVVCATLFTALTASAVLAQSAVDNIRPVGQVCMQGQPCVGQPADGSAVQSGTARASTASNTPAPAPEPTPAEPENEPAAAAQTAAADAGSDFDVEAAYNQSCMACHTTGAAGAPQLGDAEAWSERLEKGMDAVMENVYNGVGAMPARGLCMDCSDDNLRALVDYMTDQ